MLWYIWSTGDLKRNGGSLFFSQIFPYENPAFKCDKYLYWEKTPDYLKKKQQKKAQAAVSAIRDVIRHEDGVKCEDLSSQHELVS